MARGTTTMEVREDGVAVITISNPPVNALSYDGIPTHKSPLPLCLHSPFPGAAAAAEFGPDG
jgi:hypothetical protein